MNKNFSKKTMDDYRSLVGKYIREKIIIDPYFSWKQNDKIKEIIRELIIYLTQNSNNFWPDTLVFKLKNLKFVYSSNPDFLGEYSLIDNTITISESALINDDYLVNTVMHELFHVVGFEKESNDFSASMQVFCEALTENYTIDAIRSRFPSVYNLPSYQIFLFPARIINSVLGEDNVQKYFSTGKFSKIPELATDVIPSLQSSILDCIGAMETLFDSSNLHGLNIHQQHRLDANMSIETYKRAIDIWFLNEKYNFKKHRFYTTHPFSYDMFIKQNKIFSFINEKNQPILKDYIQNKIYDLLEFSRQATADLITFTISQAVAATSRPFDIQNTVNEILSTEKLSQVKDVYNKTHSDLFITTLLKTTTCFDDSDSSKTSIKVKVFDYLFSKPNGLLPNYENNNCIVATILSVAETNASGIVKYIPAKYLTSRNYYTELIKNNPSCYWEVQSDSRLPRKEKKYIVYNINNEQAIKNQTVEIEPKDDLCYSTKNNNTSDNLCDYSKK